MAQQIDIPGLGIVEFPDGMSDDDIASAIKKNIMPTLPATSAASSMGRTAAGFADTVLGGPAALANMVGYAGARALGKSPEQAKKAEIFETQPLAKAFGVGQSPEYRSEGSQRLGAFVGENIGKGAKWISDNTGLPVADVENMIGTMAAGAGVKTAPLTNKAIGLAGQAAERAAVGTGKAVAKGAKEVAQAPVSVVKGINNALKTDIPQSSVKMSEETLQRTREPNQTSLRRDDGTWDPKEVTGVNRLGELAVRLSDREIPIQGRVIENMAETAARGYKDALTGRGSQRLGGLQGVADIAGLFGMGLPVGSLIRSGIPAAIKGIAPLRAVDPAVVNTMTVGGNPVTSDIFTTRTGVPFVNRRDVSYLQDPISENAGRRTYGRTMDEQPFAETSTPTKSAGPKSAGPAPVLGLGYDKPSTLALEYNNPSPLALEYNGKTSLRNREPSVNESTEPIYATETGVAGKNLLAVDEEAFKQKYAPQPVQKPEPIAPSFKESTPLALPKPKPIIDQTVHRQEITGELNRMIEKDPSLERYAKDYVITEQNQYPLNNFLNQGAKQTLVYGGPGTGKTQLASEWLAKNRGELEYINTHGFDAKAATNLKNRLDTSQNPMLLLVDEADQLKPAQVELINNLANHPNTRLLYTTNDLSKVKDGIKNQSNIINMDIKLTPEQKKVFGLYRAVKGEMFGAPVNEIEAITNSSKSFRDIKRGVPEKTGQIDISSQKQSPMFGVQRDAIEAPPKVQKLFDDLESNALPKNMIVIDSSVYSIDPNFGTKLNSIALPSEGGIAKMLAEPTTASPTVRIVVTDETTAKQLSSLKGLIERNNETSYPTNIIVEDRHGKLDPAIRSRAITLTGKDFGANSTNPKPIK